MAHLRRAGEGARLRVVLALAVCAAWLCACATTGPAGGAAPEGGPQYMVGDAYEVNGVWYYPQEQPDYDETGLAGVYGDDLAGQATANGETVDPNAIAAAHTTLPMPVMVEVTNLDTGATLQVRVNDRGPFGEDGQIIALTRAAAEQLGFADQGMARVRVRYLGPAPLGEPGVYAGEPPAGGPVGPDYQTGAVQAQPLAAPPGGPGGYDDGYGGGPGVGPGVGPGYGGGTGGWTVQAGSFVVQSNARRAADRLRGVAPAAIVPAEVDGRTYYRVILGPWPGLEQAARARDLAAGVGFPDAIIRRPY